MHLSASALPLQTGVRVVLVVVVPVLLVVVAVAVTDVAEVRVAVV
jgi:hypothetical protein